MSKSKLKNLTNKVIAVPTRKIKRENPINGKDEEVQMYKIVPLH